MLECVLIVLIVIAIVDTEAPDGAALLGLGYGSDGDSQDSGKSPQAHKPRAVKLESALSGQAVRAVSAAVLEDQAEAGNSMSPSTAVGGWVKDEEKADSALGFVKGQRWELCQAIPRTSLLSSCAYFFLL